jgi:hypothetical protein
MAWEPPFLNGQLATSPCGGSNCLCWSTARAVERDSKGSIAAVTGDIRRWISGTTCGGTALAQNAAAVKALYGVTLDIRYSLPFADYLTLIQAGRGAATYIGYAAMHGSGFDSFPTFNGGHGVYVGETDGSRALVYDPGADGRYSGIPKGPQWWPLELLKKAAGAMPAGTGTVGYGFVSAGFTRDTEDEADVNAMLDLPIAIADIAPTALFEDRNGSKKLIANWPGSTSVGIYTECATGGSVPAMPYGPRQIRVNFGDATKPDWRAPWVDSKAVSDVRLPGAVPGDTTAAYNAGVDAAAEAAKKARK